MAPITPPMLLSTAFVASVNCSEMYEYKKLAVKSLYENLTPVLKFSLGTNSTRLPTIPFASLDVYFESITEVLKKILDFPLKLLKNLIRLIIAEIMLVSY